MSALERLYERVGTTRRSFRCCDTEFVVQTSGLRTEVATNAAERTAERLEAQLDAFDPGSAVSQLNDEGRVTNQHVARIVKRGLDYYERTDGVFDIHQGGVERKVKAYIDGSDDSLPDSFDAGNVVVDGYEVTADCRVDLNGLAKGYIVDRVASTLSGFGRRGFVSAGGDMSPPTGPIAVENPYTGDKPLKTLDTEWSVATSGGYRRQRDGVDHVYDPKKGHISSRHDSVTVLARRDCMEADAMATTIAALPLAEARAFAESWPGLEALIVHEGVFYETEKFHTHVYES